MPPELFSDDNGNRVLVRHKGPAGKGFPSGGTTGQLLAKTSNTDFAATWVNPPDGTDAVVGPTVAVDGNLVIFDGTTGKLVKDSTRSLSYFAPVSLVDTKVDKVVGKDLSTNDFNNDYKAKVDGIQSTSGYRGSFATLAAIEAYSFNPVARAGDYCLIEGTGVDAQKVLWDNTNLQWVQQFPDAVDMTGAAIAAVLFDTDDAWDQNTCRIYTESEKAQLAAHEALINSLVGGIGATSTSYVEKTSNYVVTKNDRTINCTANSFTLTLPTAVGDTGRIFVIKNSGDGIITINTVDGIQTVDGTTSYELTVKWESITIQSTGSNWILI